MGARTNRGPKRTASQTSAADGLNISVIWPSRQNTPCLTLLLPLLVLSELQLLYRTSPLKVIDHGMQARPLKSDRPCSPIRTIKVVLAASICTRGGKAVLSRQFREIARSRIEALLASFPKLADSGTQHTTVEQDNVRFVYQPLDELYIVLITNRQSNILQDIDSLHLFAQVTTSICKSLDEREILRNAFELLSAYDELVTLGYRENLSLSQIKTFLEMESHEERIQEIIERVYNLTAKSRSEGILTASRTKSSKRAKNAKERPSNWRCNEKRPLAIHAASLPELRPTLSTRPLRALLYPTPTTAMRRRRRKPSPSMF